MLASIVASKQTCLWAFKQIFIEDGPQGLTGRFYTYSVSTRVVATDWTLQREPIWLYIVPDSLVQCELELNNIYKIEQCMSSFTFRSLVLLLDEKMLWWFYFFSF